jgi:hypothetical protein
MRIISIWLLVISSLICNCSFSQTKSANKKAVTSKNTTASNKITCPFCKGTGSGEGIPLVCTNCVGWSAEYRRKVPCHICKDTRVIYERKCVMCDGTGKLDKDWYKFGMSDKTYDSTLNIALKSKGKIPVNDKPMTDDQAWKMFNDYANPALKQNGYGEIRQTIVDQYPMRPNESKTQYVDNQRKQNGSHDEVFDQYNDQQRINAKRVEDSIAIAFEQEYQKKEEKEKKEAEERRKQTWSSLSPKRDELKKFFPSDFKIEQGEQDDEILVREEGNSYSKEIELRNFQILGQFIFKYFKSTVSEEWRYNLKCDSCCIVYASTLNEVYAGSIPKSFNYKANGFQNQYYYFPDNTLISGNGEFLFMNKSNENHIAFLTSAKTAKSFNEELSVKQETNYRYLVSFDKDYEYFDVIDLQQGSKTYEHVEASKADQYCKKLFK